MVNLKANGKIIGRTSSDLVPYILYNNASGTNGSITLSDSLANYEYIEIFGRNNVEFFSGVKIANPNGKKLIFSANATADLGIYFRMVSYNASGTTLTMTKNGYRNVGQYEGWGYDNNAMWTTKVVGYK